MHSLNHELRQIAVIGNYLPRQCGIATFTTDLVEALATEMPGTTCFAIPVNDREDGYAYPSRVRFELAQEDIASYRRAADFLNINNVDVVCLQHEYGIFGGAAGSHILTLLQELSLPVVTTLHTVLAEPDPTQFKVMERLAQLSDRLVVMSQRGVRYLEEIYKVPADKIDFIPHGIPDVPFVDPNYYKDHFGVEGKQVLLTFGLLSPNKGIEHVIRALPTIRQHNPDVVYIVLGATHPHVKLHQGESYRLSLQLLAQELGVEEHVIFHDRFVSLAELIEFIGAADIYITPYLNPAQITSGTLAYTLGAGKAIISTPYWYAEELLADDRGRLVPFANSEAIARQVIDLLQGEAERHQMRKRAYQFGRDMIWPAVAHCYLSSFEKARAHRTRYLRPSLSAWTLKHRKELPLLNLNHLCRMTDGIGMLQHATFTVPNYAEGYTTDDNARALVATVLMESMGESIAGRASELSSRYMAFMLYAFNRATGRFRNFMSFNREWLEEIGSEDSHGRALWGLGLVLNRSQHRGLRDVASQLFELALPAAESFTSPRAWAFTLLGIHEYLQRFSGDRAVQGLREGLANRLLAEYQQHASPAWPWFEPYLTYSNAKLPHALLISGEAMEQPSLVAVALQTLDWLTSQQTNSGHFAPIGCNGFYTSGGERARFDQQPIEAHVTVSACLEAYRITGKERWYHEAQRAFEWFLGRNDLNLPLYDPVTGGCRDGLHADRVNQNQGAESTLAFLLSLVEMRLAESELRPFLTGDTHANGHDSPHFLARSTR